VKTLIIGAFTLTSFIPIASGQLVSDPNVCLYTHLEIWMDRGLTDKLPPLRPHPIQLVKKTLTRVEVPRDSGQQESYMSKIDGGSNVHWSGCGYVNDAAFNGLIRLDINTMAA
jgi:hypothetical protein